MTATTQSSKDLKTIQEQISDSFDLRKYTELFYSVKNVENALRLFVYENLNYYKNHDDFEHVMRFLRVQTLRQRLKEMPPKHNLELFFTIDSHLRLMGDQIWWLKNDNQVKEQIKDVWYFIHQAYKELDESNLCPEKRCLEDGYENFENFFVYHSR